MYQCLPFEECHSFHAPFFLKATENVEGRQAIFSERQVKRRTTRKQTETVGNKKGIRSEASYVTSSRLAGPEWADGEKAMKDP